MTSRTLGKLKQCASCLAVYRGGDFCPECTSDVVVASVDNLYEELELLECELCKTVYRDAPCPECGHENCEYEGAQSPDPYFSLEGILSRALLQASEGKGKQRHAKEGEPFEKQKICEITRRVGLGYPLGQAIKKAEEAQRLQHPANVHELLGAINYLAAAVLIMEEEEL